jgi:hypothetical protein
MFSFLHNDQFAKQKKLQQTKLIYSLKSIGPIVFDEAPLKSQEHEDHVVIVTPSVLNCKTF